MNIDKSVQNLFNRLNKYSMLFHPARIVKIDFQLSISIIEYHAIICFAKLIFKF